MNTNVETTDLEAVPAATQVLKARMREAEQTKEVLELLKLPSDKRVDKAMELSRQALWAWSDKIDAAREALPEGDWRAALLSERHALIEAVMDALDMLDSNNESGQGSSPGRLNLERKTP